MSSEEVISNHTENLDNTRGRGRGNVRGRGRGNYNNKLTDNSNNDKKQNFQYLQREEITIDTEIPQLSTIKPKLPSEPAFNQDIEEIDKKIQEARTELTTLNRQTN
jgi:hypothetical protein